MNTRVVRAKRLWSVRDTRVGDVGLPLLAVSIHHGVVLRSQLTEDEPRADDLSAYKVVARGDIVVNRMRAFQGAVGVAPIAGIVSPDYLVLEPKSASPRYLHYLMRSRWMVGEMSKRLRGIGSVEQGNVRTPRINIDELGDIDVPCPSSESQDAIADFLDVETERADRVVANRVKAQALLHEWLAARSEHVIWRDSLSVPLGRRTDPARPIMYGIVLPGPDVRPIGIPVVKGGDVAKERLEPDGLCRTTQEIELPYARARLRAGDVLVAIRGGIGDTAIVPPSLEGANITQDVARVAPRCDVEPGWLNLALRTWSVQADIASRVTGATVRGLNIWDLKRVRVPASDRSRQERDLAELAPDVDRVTRLGVCAAGLADART